MYISYEIGLEFVPLIKPHRLTPNWSSVDSGLRCALNVYNTYNFAILFLSSLLAHIANALGVLNHPLLRLHSSTANATRCSQADAAWPEEAMAIMQWRARNVKGALIFICSYAFNFIFLFSCLTNFLWSIVYQPYYCVLKLLMPALHRFLCSAMLNQPALMPGLSVTDWSSSPTIFSNLSMLKLNACIFFTCTIWQNGAFYAPSS